MYTCFCSSASPSAKIHTKKEYSSKFRAHAKDMLEMAFQETEAESATTGPGDDVTVVAKTLALSCSWTNDGSQLKGIKMYPNNRRLSLRDEQPKI